MGTTRRLATVGASVVAVGALFAGTATAQTADAQAGSYGGTATAEALTLNLFGTIITTSGATAELNNSPLAKATATQVLTPAMTGEVEAVVNAIGQSVETKPESCTGSELTAIPVIGRLDITCGSATATLTADGGTSRGLGAELVLEPTVSGLLEALQLQQPVQDGANQIIDSLDPLVQGLTGTPIGDLVDDTVTTVQDVVNDVLTLESTVRLVVAPALAEVIAAGDTVTSHARAQGIRIELLPVDGTNSTNNLLPDDLLPGEPLITITIGDAEATKVVSKSGAGTAESTSDAALVRVEFGSTALTDALGLSAQPIEVKAGQSICILEDTPLESCVTVANAGVDANGNPFADGASVQLLKGVNGGIDLAVGRAGTAAAAAPSLQVPVSADLPRTGGSPSVALLGGGLLAAALATRRFVFGRR